MRILERSCAEGPPAGINLLMSESGRKYSSKNTNKNHKVLEHTKQVGTPVPNTLRNTNDFIDIFHELIDLFLQEKGYVCHSSLGKMLGWMNSLVFGSGFG